jgi:hypothetical protein
MSVNVERGSSWVAGTPTNLFEGPYYNGVVGSHVNRTYDVSPDGRRFLMIKEPEPATSANLIVVQNWFEELKARVPTTR